MYGTDALFAQSLDLFGDVALVLYRRLEFLENPDALRANLIEQADIVFGT